MVSVCLPSDVLLLHLPSYLGFSYLGRGVSLKGCSRKAQAAAPYLGSGVSSPTALPELQCGMAPVGPPAPVQPPLLGCRVAPPSRRPLWGCSFRPPPLALGVGLLLPATALGLGRHSRHRMPGGSSRPPSLASDMGYLLPAIASDLGSRVALLGCSCSAAAWHSRPLPLTSDVG